MKSRGSVALGATGATQEEIGTVAECSRVAVQQWLAGETKPSKPKRAKLREKWGIADEWWEEEPLPVPAAPPPPTEGQGAIAMAAKLESMTWNEIHRIEKDAATSGDASKRAAAIAKLAATVRELAGMTSPAELGRQLVKTPMWKRIEAAIRRGLERHPAAAKDVEAELKRALAEDEAR